VKVSVTVKCRIGIDQQDPEAALDTLARGVVAAGTDALIVHARKAWLNGLSPRENRARHPAARQHNEEIYIELLDLTPEKLQSLRAQKLRRSIAAEV